MKGIGYLNFLTKLTSGKIRGQFDGAKYSIKKGYHHRGNIDYDDDRSFTDEYQREVYQLAKYYLEENNYKTVMDVGCGSAFKLMKYFGNKDTTGMDVSPTYEYLSEKYPDRKWIHASKTDEVPLESDIVICADVIEHVLEPDKLLVMINKIKFKYLFLSTPERDMLWGIQHYGPPVNPAHVREWNYREFREFVSKYFKIESHQITHVDHTTQLLICTPLD